MIFDVYEFDLTHKVKACLFEIDCEFSVKKKKNPHDQQFTFLVGNCGG